MQHPTTRSTRRVASILGTLFLAAAASVSFSSAPESQPETKTELLAFGRARAMWAPEGRDPRLEFRLELNPSREELTLKVHYTGEQGPGSHLPPFAFELGQDHPRAIYSSHLANIGEVIIVDNGWGAAMQRLVILAVHGPELRTLLDIKSRFGWTILDLTNDGTPEVCIMNGDVGITPVEAVTFQWNGSKFEMANKMQVDAAHRYRIEGIQQDHP